MLHTDSGRYATERVLIKEASNSISAVREHGPVFSQLRRTSDPNLTLSQSEPPQGFCPPKISLSYVIANLS